MSADDRRQRRVKVPEAGEIFAQEEAAKLIDQDDAGLLAITGTRIYFRAWFAIRDHHIQGQAGREC